jgi:hypothetical protein
LSNHQNKKANNAEITEKIETIENYFFSSSNKKNKKKFSLVDSFEDSRINES